MCHGPVPIYCGHQERTVTEYVTVALPYKYAPKNLLQLVRGQRRHSVQGFLICCLNDSICYCGGLLTATACLYGQREILRRGLRQQFLDACEVHPEVLHVHIAVGYRLLESRRQATHGFRLVRFVRGRHLLLHFTYSRSGPAAYPTGCHAGTASAFTSAIACANAALISSSVREATL